MTFTQTIVFYADDPEPIRQMIVAWDRDERDTAPGYKGGRLLADRDEPGRYLLIVDFDSPEEAAANNERAATNDWARALQEAIRGEPEYGNHDEIYWTG